MKGKVKLGAVDMTKDQSVGAKYNIKGFPTLKFFGKNKQKPNDYNAGRTADYLVEYCLRKYQTKDEADTTRQASQNLTVLEDDNFDDLVLDDDKEGWLVMFYAP